MERLFASSATLTIFISEPEKTFPMLVKDFPVSEKTLPIMIKTYSAIEKPLSTLEKAYSAAIKLLLILKKTCSELVKTVLFLEIILPEPEQLSGAIENAFYGITTVGFGTESQVYPVVWPRQ